MKSERGGWAVILCGGRGLRMGEQTRETPKPLLMVQGRPILWYIFWTLFHSGVRRFIFPLGHGGGLLADWLGRFSSDPRMEILCEPTGEDTPIVDRMRRIAHHLPAGADFLLLNGDTIIDADLPGLLGHHRAREAWLTLSSVAVTAPWGTIAVEDGVPIRFSRDEPLQTIHRAGTTLVINSGVAVLSQEALALLDDPTITEFEVGLYSRVMAMKRTAHVPLGGFWMPIETQKDLHRLADARDPAARAVARIQAKLARVEGAHGA